MKIFDSQGIHYRVLNKTIRDWSALGETRILVKNIEGQRYLATGLRGPLQLTIEGTPGNDMSAYMDGPTVEVKGNAQDVTGNTMNSGRIIIHGNTGDTAGYAMRGGEIIVRGNVGYRTGIHMKEYMTSRPVIVAGGASGDFLGEYMAGGIIILLGTKLDHQDDIAGSFFATGMHGGRIFTRFPVDPRKVSKDVILSELDNDDRGIIDKYINMYSEYFGSDLSGLDSEGFVKYVPLNSRPYGKLYTH